MLAAARIAETVADRHDPRARKQPGGKPVNLPVRRFGFRPEFAHFPQQKNQLPGVGANSARCSNAARMLPGFALYASFR